MVSEGMHNVFPGDTFIEQQLPFSKDKDTEEEMQEEEYSKYQSGKNYRIN